MKKAYTTAEFSIVRFEAEEAIVASAVAPVAPVFEKDSDETEILR